jgi:hypothetical protein
MSITTIIIPQQRLLPKGHQLPQCVRNKCKQQHFADQRKSQGSYAQCNYGNNCHHQHGQCKQHKLCNNSGCGDNKHNNKKSPPSARTRVSSPDAYMASTPTTHTASAALIRAIKGKNYNNKCKQQQKNTAAMTRAPHIMHATIAGQAAN